MDVVHKSDMWQFCGFKVITTNLQTRKDGTAIMGAGLAKQAADRYPELPILYGERLLSGAKGGRFQYEDLLLLPTKRHWREKSDLPLIKEGIAALRQWCLLFPDERLAIPPLGCGLGGLNLKTQVLPLLNEAFVFMKNVTLYLP